MHRSNLILRLLLALVAMTMLPAGVLASENYRAHRYNEFKGLAVNENSIVFVGNSITDMQNWPEAFGNDPRIISRGVSGGYSFEMLANVANWVTGHPAKVFIKIGTNDLRSGYTTQSVADNIRKTVDIIRQESPATQIYLQSILPAADGGNKSDATIAETNNLIEAICQETENCTYIDLNSKLTGIKTQGWPYSADADHLHISALSYKIWCETIEPYMDGLKSVYPEDTEALQNRYDDTTVFGLRCSYFSVQPTCADDIIFIGDGLVQSGEWNELLPGSGIKNHGSGWEVSAGSIANTSTLIDATLAANGSVKREMPKAVILYTGSTGYDATAYEALVSKIHGYGQDIKVYCVSLLPNIGGYTTSNESIEAICEATDNTEYIDVATALAGHTSEAAYFTNNHPYYMSYVTIAQQIAAQATDLALTAITTQEAQRNYTITTTYEALLKAEAGDRLGQYPAEKVQAVKEAMEMMKSATTDEEVSAASAAVTAANTALLQAINAPTEANTAGRHFSLGTPNRLSLVAYSDGTTLNATSSNPGYAKYRWTMEMREDGKVNIRNVANNAYIAPSAPHNTQIQMSATAPAEGWSLDWCDNQGLYIIHSGTTCQLNSTDKSGNPIFNWYGGGREAQDRADLGCQWQVIDVTDIPVVNEPEPIVVVTGKAQEGTATIEDGRTYTITNHQQSGTCYPLYVNEGSLQVGEANALAAKSYGRRAKFVAEAKGDKFAFRNEETGQYLIWRGNDSGYNNNAGVMDDYNSTYCDLTITAATELTNAKLITGKRNGGTENGTFVQNADGTWNKWRDATVGYTATYSNLYTFGDVTDGNDGETEVEPEPEPEEASFTIQTTNSTLLRGGSSVVTSGWFSTIKSNTTPQVTIQATGNINNITTDAANFILAEGNATSFTYTVSVPAGYVITGMSATITSTESTPVIDFAGKTVKTTTRAQKVSVTDLDSHSVNVVMTSTASNAKARFANWTVDVKKVEISHDPNIILSTDEEQHWYYIYSASTSAYCQGKVWQYDADADRMKFTDKAFLADRIWSFWKNADGKLAIKNYDGIYVGTAGGGTGSNTQFGKAADANYIYGVEFYADGQFTISDGGVCLHAQQDGSVIVRWAASENGASLWNFEEVDMSDTRTTISATTVQQGKVTTGIGNKDVAILRSTLTVSGLSGNIDFQGVSGQIKATDLKDVKAVRAYFAKNAQELFVDADGKMTWREANAIPFAEGTISEDGSYTIEGSRQLASGKHYLWIALDIADDAKEGNTVDATITSYNIDGEQKAETAGNPAYVATIFLSEGSVLMPMDKGSLYYRIPAIATSADGKRLVTLTDDRKNHNADLPSHCYVVAQYSEDNGRTWSDPVTVAGTASTGGDYGHGDASLITNRINGDIIGIMTCATNGAGYFGSTPDRPQTWKTIVSHDGGLTWETPVDHTKSLYGTGSPNPNWLGGFTGSGAGLQKRDGTLVSPFVNRESPDGTNNNVSQNYYNFMSKDGGKTWYVSGKSGTTAADEPKVLERNNGDLAISVRAGGYNFHNVTSDDGQTWSNPAQTRFTSGISGNACDGEYMYWCSTLDGNPWNIVFQTLPNSGSRENVSIALSTDEGETFGSAKTICPRGSAYSAATVLPDGTVGVYYEENGLFGGYTMRFVRFSLNWASNGQYSFTEEQPFQPIQSKVNVKTSSCGVQTIILPHTQEIPEGMTVYECTTDTMSFDDAGTLRVGTILQPVADTQLQAFHPYVYMAEPEAEFTFLRPTADWQAEEMREDCSTASGALQGWVVEKKVKANGSTIYTEPRVVSAKGGLVFNRPIRNTTLSMAAYSANYMNPEFTTSTPSAVRILTQDEVDGLHSVSGNEASACGTVYDLGGRKYLMVPDRGIYIVDGKKVAY